MVICTGELIIITNAVNNTGRPDHVARGIARAVAMERMRLTRQKFHGYGTPSFGGRLIYRTSVPWFDRVIGRAWRDRCYTLPIVAK